MGTLNPIQKKEGSGFLGNNTNTTKNNDHNDDSKWSQ